MDSQFAILPAAIGMMLGPQILSSIFLATSEKWSRPNSWAYVAGVALGATLGMAVAYFVATLYEAATDDSEQASDLLIYVIVALLVFLSIRTFLTRKTAEPPKWMARLQVAEPGFSFRLGLLLVMLLPANIVILFAAGAYLVDNDFAFVESFWLIGATTLIAALPILTIVIFGEQADHAMPGV